MSDYTLQYIDCPPFDLDDRGLISYCTFAKGKVTDVWGGAADRAEEWRMWHYVVQDEGEFSGQPQIFYVPVDPGGPGWHRPNDLGWGLQCVTQGEWQITPSINHIGRWHHTPRVVGVPEPPPWDEAP